MKTAEIIDTKELVGFMDPETIKIIGLFENEIIGAIDLFKVLNEKTQLKLHPGSILKVEDHEKNPKFLVLTVRLHGKETDIRPCVTDLVKFKSQFLNKTMLFWTGIPEVMIDGIRSELMLHPLYNRIDPIYLF